MAAYVFDEGYRVFPIRLLDESKCFANGKSLLSYHLCVGGLGRDYYKLREREEGALEIAIQLAKEQITIGPDVAEVLRNEHSKSIEFLGPDLVNPHYMPSHWGFKQLAIIYDKKNLFEEAITCCKDALKQGWMGDWEKRIHRYQKKLSKRK